MTSRANDPNDIAATLGLEGYQLELFHLLAAQAERQGIPVDALPTLAKYLDRIDWDPILSTPAEAAAILGVEERSVTRMVSSAFEWMQPFIWVRATTGETVVRLWLTAKVRAFSKVRQKD